MSFADQVRFIVELARPIFGADHAADLGPTNGLSHLALSPATIILMASSPGTSARSTAHTPPAASWRGGQLKDGQLAHARSTSTLTTDQFISPTGLRVRQDLYDEDYSDEDYEQMLSMYEGTMAQIVEGEIVKSKVLRVTDNAVILDVGFKSEGSVPLDEFKDPQSLKEGDEVEVFLEHLEDQEGAVVLSKKKADFMRVWEKIRVAHESDQPVEGTLVKKIKGGVVVNLMGVDAFLPGSQIALRRVPNIDELLGQTYEFKIIKLNKRRRNIVVSRRVILENERAHKREHLMKELAVGQVRKGVVKNITDFGAFIDLGGVDGLLHITDMSYGRVSHPTEMVAIGKEVEVKILDIDWQRERISLGMKQLQSYPWQNVAAQVSGRHPGAGQGGLDHQLRRLRRDRARHRGPGPHLRDELDPQRPAPVQDREHRRDHRSGGAQGGRGRGEDLARHEADRAGSLDGAAAQVPGGHPDQRQGAEPHQLRRLRRDRAGHRRADPHLRHVAGPSGSSTRPRW